MKQNKALDELKKIGTASNRYFSCYEPGRLDDDINFESYETVYQYIEDHVKFLKDNGVTTINEFELGGDWFRHIENDEIVYSELVSLEYHIAHVLESHIYDNYIVNSENDISNNMVVDTLDLCKGMIHACAGSTFITTQDDISDLISFIISDLDTTKKIRTKYFFEDFNVYLKDNDRINSLIELCISTLDNIYVNKYNGIIPSKTDILTHEFASVLKCINFDVTNNMLDEALISLKNCK